MFYNALSHYPYVFNLLLAFTALSVAGIVSFLFTPLTKKLAFRVGAISVPKDDRRMHSKPMALMGGLAIFIGFVTSVLLFCPLDKQDIGLLIGGFIIIVGGVIDDIFTVKFFHKLPFQFVAALIIVLFGTRIGFFSDFHIFGNGTEFTLGFFEIPVTILWIMGITNAVNFIDGLDGLACGISCISSLSMLIICLLLQQYHIALVIAALTGSCLGFLPFNFNPAKIFMGETGAAFLGFVLAVTSIRGLFKIYTLIFVIPFLVICLPIFDIFYNFFRRLFSGTAPWKADKNHIHHRLVKLGFSHKQTVAILYLVSIVMGISAVIMVENGAERALIVIAVALLAVIVGLNIYLRLLKGDDSDIDEDSTDAVASTDTVESVEEIEKK